MVAAYVASTHLSYGGGSQTSAALTASSSTADDLAIVFLQIESTSKTITKPTGWTLEHEATATAGGSFTITSYLLWKFLDGTEDASDWTFSWSGGAWRTADAVSIRGGVTSGNPFGGTVGSQTGSNGTRLSVSYTTSGVGLGFWFHSEYQDSAGVTLPSGYTGRASHGDHEFRFATRSDSSSGSLTTGSTTGASTTYVVMGQTLLDTAGGTDGDVTAVTATATATAVAPTVTGGAETASVAATSTALAEPPTVSGETVLEGGPATATAEAYAPTVIGGASVDATVATATALALPPTVSAAGAGDVLAVPATATAEAVAPTVDATQTVEVVAVSATATAMAHPPVVAGGAGATDGDVLAVVATATAQVSAPTVTAGATVAMNTRATAFAQIIAPVVAGVISITVEAVAATATARGRVPVISTPTTLYRFEPPTHEAPMRSPERIHQFFRLTHAASVVRVNGALTSIHQPRPDQITAAGREGVDWFLGGRVYDVPAEVKAELLAAGFYVE